VVHAASITDILGIDPAVVGNREQEEKSKVPRKWMTYYKSLLALRKHFCDELDIHTKGALTLDGEGNGDNFAGFGKDQTDPDSGQFDGEVALSMLASEQDALHEVEEAIQRIINGTYGICEITGKPIKKSRLAAVPFTRYSMEGQQQLEAGGGKKKGDRQEVTFAERDEDSSQLMATGEDE